MTDKEREQLEISQMIEHLFEFGIALLIQTNGQLKKLYENNNRYFKVRDGSYMVFYGLVLNGVVTQQFLVIVTNSIKSLMSYYEDSNSDNRRIFEIIKTSEPLLKDLDHYKAVMEEAESRFGK